MPNTSGINKLPAHQEARPEQPATTRDGGKQKPTQSKAATPDTRTADRRKTCIVLAIILIVVIVLAVALSIVFTRDSNDKEQENSVNFETGVSLVTSYGVNATITSRLARTILTVVVANALDCAAIHGITVQLPWEARVASLKTIADDGCNTHGKVQPLKEARESFIETAAGGLPGAYVEERDSLTKSLQVAMPPLGSTKVELVLEQLLRQRVGQVQFELPFTPNEEIDQMKFDISILDIGREDPTTTNPTTTAIPPTNTSTLPNATTTPPPVTHGTNFHLDLYHPDVTTNATDTLHIDIPDAREHELPKVISGHYIPSDLPQNGVLYTDGTCFEHFFLPANIEPMPKNIFFLIDISESNHYHEKFQQSKAALKTFIDSLTPLDTLTIQAFAEVATEELWGSAKATEEEKINAKHFVDNLSPRCCGTDLHEAYLVGLLRAISAADASANEESGAVTVLVMMSDSWPSRGETDRARIASAVWKLNQEGKVKMFSLGFHDADRELLSAIAIMNDGVALPLLEGHVDYATQMERFFESQFGDVLLSDVQVKFAGDTEAYGETQRTFPVLADGTEIVVRGLLTDNTSSWLEATTTAKTKGGEAAWTVTAVQDPFVSTPGLANSRCFQSYAHSRINQLLHWRDAAELLGDEVLEPVVYLTKPCPSGTSLVDCIEQEALSLAIEANVVTEGLTGMVTEDEENCQTFQGETEICLDGTSMDGYGRPPEAGDSGENDDWISTSGTAAQSTFTVLVLAIVTWLALEMLA